MSSETPPSKPLGRTAPGPTGTRAVVARRAGVRRTAAITGWIAVGSAAGVGGFAALAAAQSQGTSSVPPSASSAGQTGTSNANTGNTGAGNANTNANTGGQAAQNPSTERRRGGIFGGDDQNGDDGNGDNPFSNANNPFVGGNTGGDTGVNAAPQTPQANTRQAASPSSGVRGRASLPSVSRSRGS